MSACLSVCRALVHESRPDAPFLDVGSYNPYRSWDESIERAYAVCDKLKERLRSLSNHRSSPWSGLAFDIRAPKETIPL